SHARHPHCPAFPTRRSSDLPGGDTQVSVVSLITLTLVAGAPPKSTVFGPGLPREKPEPVSVTMVPPSAGPMAGRSEASAGAGLRSEEHTSELQSRVDLVCRL